MKSALRAARTAANPPKEPQPEEQLGTEIMFLELVARQRTPDLPDGQHR